MTKCYQILVYYKKGRLSFFNISSSKLSQSHLAESINVETVINKKSSCNEINLKVTLNY